MIQRYIEKTVELQIADQKYSIKGKLSGYDIFMNIVLEKAEMIFPDKRVNLGHEGGPVVIRGSEVSHFTCSLHEN